MGAVNTNSISLALAVETEPGKVPGSGAKAEFLEPNALPDYGGSITTTSRSPISADRQRRKGTITDFSSTVSVEQDLTLSSFLSVIEGAVLAEWQGAPAFANLNITATGVALGATADFALPAGTLILLVGYKNNTGIKKLSDAVVSGTSTELKFTGAVAETPAAAYQTRVFVIGYEGASGDLSLTVTNKRGTLSSAAGALAGLPLTRGCGIWLGGSTESTSFTWSSSVESALARVVSVGSTIELDRISDGVITDAGASKTIQIFFGRFMRNVSVNDALFQNPSYSMELVYPDLIADGTDGYEYSVGNSINTMELAMPLNDKATLNFTTFGTDTLPVTETSQNWSTTLPIFTEAFSTPTDFLRLRMQGADEEGLTTFWKDATLTINNNIGSENVLAKLGPAYTNLGTLNVTLAGNAVFTDKLVTQKIRNNCTCSADLCLYNNEGALYFDIPTLTIGDGKKDFAVNEKIKISLSGESFSDPEWGYSIGITFFPYLPTAKANLC